MPILTPIKTTTVDNWEEFCEAFNFQFNEDDDDFDEVLIINALNTLPQNFTVTKADDSNMQCYFVINQY